MTNLDTMTWNECDHESERLSAEITEAYKRSDYALIQELEMKRDLVRARIEEYSAQHHLELAAQIRQGVTEYRSMTPEVAGKIDAFLQEHKLRLNRGHGFQVELAGYSFSVVPIGNEWANRITDVIPDWKDRIVAFNAQFEHV